MRDDDPVRQQYERWPYPTPPADLVDFPFDGPGSRYADLRTNTASYWPTRAPREELDVLVAGCGTFAGAVFAYFYPRARVTAIDVSAASLAHEERLRKKHGLANLMLAQLRLEDIAQLRETYDFISVMGVLHHLEDPAAGLAALGARLKPDGVLSAQVYGRHGRGGVAMVRELAALLGLAQEQRDVSVVRHALAAMPPWHPVRGFVDAMREQPPSDAALVDAFLHRRERTYSVGECLALVRAAGLAFQGWEEPHFYHAESWLPAAHPFRQELERLPEEERWQAAELAHGGIFNHVFHACRRERPIPDYRVDFAGSPFLAWRPVRRVDRAEPRGERLALSRGALPEAVLEPRAARLFLATGDRTVAECMREAGLDPGTQADVEVARAALKALWTSGFMAFRW